MSTVSRPNLKAPFPYFGGKSRVAAEIWQRLGDVPNYVEPFCGSLAILLSRPTAPGTETVNDADCYLSNFWRALQHDPDAVASWADWPVNEADLLARHRWLLSRAEFVERMRSDPDYYDPKVAGWWVWGACSWIGQGWCRNESEQLPHLGNAGRGINRKLPHLGNAGMGINRKLPHLGNAGRGINRKLPHLGNAGRGAGVDAPAGFPTSKGQQILAYFRDLAERLRGVRVACGDWRRVLGPSVTFRHGITGIVFDPPYGEGNMDYSAGGNSTNIAQDVRDWAVANGDNPDLRIVCCGYEGAVEFPPEWECLAWKNRGGYGSQGDGEGRENAARERIWFSPHCLKPATTYTLFGSEVA